MIDTNLRFLEITHTSMSQIDNYSSFCLVWQHLVHTSQHTQGQGCDLVALLILFLQSFVLLFIQYCIYKQGEVLKLSLNVFFLFYFVIM